MAKKKEVVEEVPFEVVKKAPLIKEVIEKIGIERIPKEVSYSEVLEKVQDEHKEVIAANKLDIKLSDIAGALNSLRKKAGIGGSSESRADSGDKMAGIAAFKKLQEFRDKEGLSVEQLGVYCDFFQEFNSKFSKKEMDEIFELLKD